MKKIPTLFLRIYENHKVTGITNILTSSELQVVLDGKCIPTIKIDGACCAVINGEWYKRYDAKKGKKAPKGAIPCQDEPDEITGHWPHWVKLDETKADDKWFIEAFKNYKELYELPDGTYEAIGPHFQGNPYKREKDSLYKHGSVIDEDCPHDFEGLKRYLEERSIEGIVFWYNNEPLCKIKRSDFGFEWPVKENNV